MASEMRHVRAMISVANFPVIPNQNVLLPLALVIGVLGGIKIAVDLWIRDKRRERRRTYYRDDHLKSNAWRRKRAPLAAWSFSFARPAAVKAKKRKQRSSELFRSAKRVSCSYCRDRRMSRS
jgi:hypothetical protein